MDKVWRIGLTGGIGSGKSTAAHVLAQLGAAVIDADAVARSVTAPGAQVKKQLETIVHPLVKAAIDGQAQSALDAGARVLVFDIPLLVESGRWRERVDGVLVIDCSEDTQIARVQARNGWPRAQILAVIQAQATRAQRQAAADWLILNEGLGLDAFEAAVAQLARQWGLPTPGRDSA